MKKRFCIIIVVFFFIYYSIPVNAQFVQGIGITAGATYAHQKWLYSETNTTRNTSSKFGFNGSFFLEMVDNYYWRWVSEIQYNRKGAIEKPLPDLKLKNKINYLSWNNFLKFRQELSSTTVYLLAGPRLEYKLSTNAQYLPDIINASQLIHLSISGGGGIEFINNAPWIPFIEFQYNPDLEPAYREKTLNDITVKNKAYELRVGIKYQLGGNKDCPPVYITPGMPQ